MTDYAWSVGIVLTRSRNLRFTAKEAFDICCLCDEPEENGGSPNQVRCSECPAGKKPGGPVPQDVRAKIMDAKIKAAQERCLNDD